MESMWCRAKQRNKHKCGTTRELLASYLMEFIWRQKLGNNLFQKLLEHIKKVYTFGVRFSVALHVSLGSRVDERSLFRFQLG